jgi:hypothetical protein
MGGNGGGGGSTVSEGTAESTNMPGDDLVLLTLEGIVVGKVPLDFALTNQIVEGDLLKFDLDGVYEVSEVCSGCGEVSSGDGDGVTCLLRNPVFKGKCSPNRALADSW